ncbi:TolC family protein [Bradyrhizobium sp. SZCCHNS1054]|uniref:TolC family protein n=1 Tax=Bradyrhizobium sp. SZCCHNS1054 TaxID=3057301 RepID=UPI002916EFCD|nr:TolC family protein [Bradyrhizobium sp. SZCCHNS1054]
MMASGPLAQPRWAVALSLLVLAVWSLSDVVAPAREAHMTPASKPKRAPVRAPRATEANNGTAESQGAKGIGLSLADAVFMALRDNRTIRSAYIDRIAQKFDLRVAEDRFTPHFGVAGGARQRIGDNVATSAEVTPTATVLLPTGATFGFAWSNTMTDAGGANQRTSAADIVFNQPLLRGGGVDVTMAPLRSSRLAERINRLRLKATVSETIGRVIFAYRDLLGAQEELKLAQASVARAQNLLEVNRAMIEAGRMAAVDVVQTEADLENQRIRVLGATRGVDAARLQLVNLLALDLGTAVVAREGTNPTRIEPDLTRLMGVAFAERPDYLGQLLVIEQNKLGIVVADNQRLWDLSVFANGRFGRTITSGAISDARPISDLTVGVAFNAPLNDLRRDYPAVQAATSLQQAELQLVTIRQGVELQIRNSVTEVRIRWHQLEAARRTRELAARAVDIENEKLKVGRSSNFQVRLLENDLRSAESLLLSTTLGYLNSLTVLDLQLGTTLATWRIALTD